MLKAVVTTVVPGGVAWLEPHDFPRSMRTTFVFAKVATVLIPSETVVKTVVKTKTAVKIVVQTVVKTKTAVKNVVKTVVKTWHVFSLQMPTTTPESSKGSPKVNLP